MIDWTPGPWAPRKSTLMGTDIVGPNGEDIGYVNAENADSTERYPLDANARLIAAAPDLYAALKTLLSCVGEEKGWQARIAMKKAEGEESAMNDKGEGIGIEIKSLTTNVLILSQKDLCMAAHVLDCMADKEVDQLKSAALQRVSDAILEITNHYWAETIGSDAIIGGAGNE